MTHVRQQIRDDIVTTLTGLATTGSNVFRSRIFPLEETNLPALCIYTKSEASEYDTIGLPRSVNRVLDVAVEAYVKGVSNYDNTLDTIAVEVEDNIGLDLVNTGRVEVYEDKVGITDRAVGLTKKSASSLVKRNTKKNAK